jgi:hypothetical protein
MIPAFNRLAVVTYRTEKYLNVVFDADGNRKIKR